MNDDRLFGPRVEHEFANSDRDDTEEDVEANRNAIGKYLIGQSQTKALTTSDTPPRFR